MLTSPEPELLWTWPGMCGFEADGSPGLPPACLSCVPSEGSSSICCFPAWGLHNVITWSYVLQCLVFHCSVLILLPRAHLLLFLFCFVFSSREIGCIRWFDLVPRLHLKDIVYFQNPQLCLCSRLQTSLSLWKEGANPPFGSCPTEPLAQGCLF